MTEKVICILINNNILDDLTLFHILQQITFFSSLVGGALKKYIVGAYRKFNIAIPKSIHSNPMVFTKVPLIAGPEILKLILDTILVKRVLLTRII